MSRPAAPVLPPATQPDRIWFTEGLPLGIQFTERMTGYASAPVDDPDERVACRKAAELGEENRWTCDCTLTIVSDDLERMLSEWQHEAQLVGTVTVRYLSPNPMTVREGRFRLFEVCADRVETRRMWYRMTVTPDGGATLYYIEGYKEVRNSLPFRAWADLTTLYLTVSTGNHGRDGNVIAQGILKLSLGDFLRQLTTIRARHARRFVERLDTPVRFIGFFAGILLSTYGRVLAPSIVATPDPPPRWPTRRGAVKPDEPIPVTTSDGFLIHLTRYPGDRNRPVILAPGFGVAASSYAADTVQTNLVEYLCGCGFDVWLLDYRASPVFPPPRMPFSIDDIARHDLPAAVDEVLDRTRAPQVQILGHCVSALALVMSLLDGRLVGKVRSVICSQVGAHPIVAPQNEVKVGTYLANALRLFGLKQVSASFNARAWGDWTMDQLLKLYPTRERCNSPVCRRILFIFHESFRHAQLNTATHDAMWRWYGSANLTALKQLSLMIREGQLLDEEGHDVYLPNVRARLQQLPMSFMHGSLNRAFLPRSTQITYDWLMSNNRGGPYKRREFCRYGHMDCFVGRQAAQDVYPWIVGELLHPPLPS